MMFLFSSLNSCYDTRSFFIKLPTDWFLYILKHYMWGEGGERIYNSGFYFSVSCDCKNKYLTWSNSYLNISMEIQICGLEIKSIRPIPFIKTNVQILHKFFHFIIPFLNLWFEDIFSIATMLSYKQYHYCYQ